MERLNYVQWNWISETVVSCYRPPSGPNITAHEWSTFFSQFSGRFLVVGDFNAHHSLWGDSRDCSVGKNIVDGIESLDVGILNEGQLTFHSGAYDSQSAIDITFVNDSSTLSYSWTVGESSWGSDHFPIVIEFEGQTRLNINHRPIKRLHTRKTDWSEFSRELKDRMNTTPEVHGGHGDPLQRYSSFATLVETGTIKATPLSNTLINGSRRKVKDSRPPCPWWNEECDKLIRIRKATFLSFKHLPSRANFLSFKRAEIKAKAGLRKMKKESFIKFCEGLSKNTNPTYLWRKIKCFKNRFNYKNNANAYNEEKVKSAVAMIEKLCPPGIETPIPSFHNPRGDPFLELPFTEDELEFAISNVNLKSSPGVDRIDHKIIAMLPEKARSLLLEIYNEILATQSFPEEWRKYNIFFIPKADSSNLRPISLAPCLCKLFEKMLNYRICWWLEYYEKLPKSQFGFRKSKSYMDNLSILCSQVIKEFKSGETVSAVFLDIQSAYDNVLADVLLERLRILGFPSSILAFIFNFVSSRSLSFKFSDIDEARWSYKGLSQGSVRSPLLYAIYVMKLESSIDPRCEILQYADDVVVFSTSRFGDGSINNIKNSLKEIKKELMQLGLAMAPEKTKFITFDRKRTKNRRTQQFNFEGVTIRESKVVQFLGVQLQANLGWGAQI